MATSKPISTISYNTDNFLRRRLDELTNIGTLQAWFYIHHLGESKDDESPCKEHIHLLVLPNKRVDLVKFQQEFVEINPVDLKKPLRCMPFRNSVVNDWFLYALHDPIYLSQKGMVKEHEYKPEQFIASDSDFLTCCICEAFRQFSASPVLAIREAIEKGISFDALVYSGRIPLAQIANARLLYGTLLEYSINKFDDEATFIQGD